MKKIFLFLAISFVFSFALTAQVTQAESDSIVLERMSLETRPHTIYAKETLQTEGISITTATGELLELNYPCWIYYIRYDDQIDETAVSIPYFIVKESNGNLLRVNTTNDAISNDMEEWTVMPKEPEDFSYPTTIYRLSEETLLQMRNDFAQRNPTVYTSLNQFGFCAMLSPGGGNGSPGGFTEEEAMAAVKEFVSRNPEYTGVINPNDLQFRMISSSIGFNDAVFWGFRTENQKINNIEVDYTEILFQTQNKKLVSCYGNFFPNVYVPEKFNFDIERAKSLLLEKEIIHWGWGGPYSAGLVTTDHLQQSTAKLIIVPIKTNEKIELRVAWQIYLKTPLDYIFEIDVMTGKIIREMPTIIH